MTARRFPPPWTIEEHNAACFIVRDKNKQAFAYVYFEEEPGRRSAANLLTRDQQFSKDSDLFARGGARLSDNEDPSFRERIAIH